MKAYCYVLFSTSVNKFYIGVTSETVESRISKHNTGFYGKGHFTSQANDWKLFFLFEVDKIEHALRIVKKIKSMKSSKYIRNLTLYPELSEKIKIETE